LSGVTKAVAALELPVRARATFAACSAFVKAAISSLKDAETAAATRGVAMADNTDDTAPDEVDEAEDVASFEAPGDAQCY